MSQWLPKMRPRRMMHGAIIGGSATNYSTASLYNDSTSAEMLCVWVVKAYLSRVPVYLLTRQGTFGTQGGVVAPMVVGEAPRAGKLYFLDAAAAVAPDGLCENLNTSDLNLPTGLPYAILQPGWSLTVQDNNTGQSGLWWSFIWQAIHPQDLDGRPCVTCEPELFVVTQS